MFIDLHITGWLGTDHKTTKSDGVVHPCPWMLKVWKDHVGSSLSDFLSDLILHCSVRWVTFTLPKEIYHIFHV